MRTALPALLLLVFAAGCEVEREVTTSEETSAPVEALTDVAAAAPAFAPDFPGGETTSSTTSISTEQRTAWGDAASGARTSPKSTTRTESKTFTTAEPPAAVVAFYKRSAMAGGLRGLSESQSTQGRQELTASGDERRLTVVAAPEKGRTAATVTYTVPAG